MEKDLLRRINERLFSVDHFDFLNRIFYPELAGRLRLHLNRRKLSMQVKIAKRELATRTVPNPLDAIGIRRSQSLPSLQSSLPSSLPALYSTPSAPLLFANNPTPTRRGKKTGNKKDLLPKSVFFEMKDTDLTRWIADAEKTLASRFPSSTLSSDFDWAPTHQFAINSLSVFAAVRRGEPPPRFYSFIRYDGLTFGSTALSDNTSRNISFAQRPRTHPSHLVHMAKLALVTPFRITHNQKTTYLHPSDIDPIDPANELSVIDEILYFLSYGTFQYHISPFP